MEWKNETSVRKWEWNSQVSKREAVRVDKSWLPYEQKSYPISAFAMFFTGVDET